MRFDNARTSYVDLINLDLWRSSAVSFASAVVTIKSPFLKSDHANVLTHMRLT